MATMKSTLNATPNPIQLTEEETQYLQQKGFSIEEERPPYGTKFPYLVLGDGAISSEITYHMTSEYKTELTNKHPGRNTQENLLAILEATVAVNGSVEGRLFTMPTGNKIKIFVIDPVWEEIAAILVAKYPIDEKAQCETIRQSFEQKLAIPVESVHPNLSGFEMVDYKGRDIRYIIRTGYDAIDIKKTGIKINLSFNKLPASTDGDTNVGDISDKSIGKMKGNIEDCIDQVNFFYEYLQADGITIGNRSLNYRDIEKNEDGDYCLTLYQEGGKDIHIVFNKNKNMFEVT